MQELNCNKKVEGGDQAGIRLFLLCMLTTQVCRLSYSVICGSNIVGYRILVSLAYIMYLSALMLSSTTANTNIYIVEWNAIQNVNFLCSSNLFCVHLSIQIV
jgi:hypothetical protein